MDKHRASRVRWLSSFAGAPQPIKDLARAGLPALKTHQDTLRRARLTEADNASQDSKKHTWRDPANGGFHGVGVLSRLYPGWDSAESFVDCSAHSLMNNARDMVSSMSNAGKMKYR